MFGITIVALNKPTQTIAVSEVDNNTNRATLGRKFLNGRIKQAGN
jgi:hypothetical protein